MKLFASVVAVLLLSACASSDTGSVSVESIPLDERKAVVLQQFKKNVADCKEVAPHKSPAFDACMTDRGYTVTPQGYQFPSSYPSSTVTLK